MPGHRTHNYVDMKLFGKAYWKLHRKMDLAVFWLGRKHRQLFHDIPTAVFIARDCYPNDPNAEQAAYTHILLDNFCSAYPAWKALLEQLAYADIKRRRRDRQAKSRRGRRRASKLREEAIVRKLVGDLQIFRGMARC